MKAHYLGHIVFYVKDLQRSLMFYEDLLGFQNVGKLDFPFQAVALTSGRTHHEILLIEVGSARKAPKGHRLGLYHIGIKVGDSLDELRQVKTELENAKVRINGSLTKNIEIVDHDIQFSIYFEDPFGNPYEITSYDYDILTNHYERKDD